MTTNTDRELLELAAKAIGLKLRYNYLGGRDANQPWDPLEDDGDALRLAVYLDFGVEVMQSLALVRAGNGDQKIVEVHWNLKDVPDAFTATRRAIVRAASEIGKAKP